MKNVKSLSQLLALVLAVLFVGNANAQEQKQGLGLYSLGAKIGLMSPSGLGSTLGFALQADVGDVASNLALFPSISFWQKKSTTSIGGDYYDYYTGEYVNNTTEVSTSLRQIGIQVDAHYYFNPDAKVNFYGGGGLGLFIHSASVEASSGTQLAEADIGSATNFGFNILAGVETPLSQKTRIIGELRYTIVSGFSTLGLNAGVSFDLLN